MDIGQILVGIADMAATASATAHASTLTPPEMPEKATLTQRVLVHMLRENTGASILDSGGTSGRAWQQNQLVDFFARPRATATFRAYTYGDRPMKLEIDFTLDVFHFLSNAADYDRAMTRAYNKFAALPENADDCHLGLMEAFPEWIGERRGVDVEKRFTDNSYNCDNFLSQIIQYVTFEYDGRVYALVQIHGGADARGGYTAPKAFLLNDEYELSDYYRGMIAPNHAEVMAYQEAALAAIHAQPALFPQLDAEKRYDVDQAGRDVYWDLGSCESNGEACEALDSYPVIEVETREEWRAGVICVLSDGTALCPVTGARLEAHPSY